MQTAIEVPRTMAGRLLMSVNGVDNVTTWRGDLIVRTMPANGKPKPDAPQKCDANGPA